MTNSEQPWVYYDAIAKTCEVSFLHGSDDYDIDGKRTASKTFATRRDPKTGKHIDQVESDSPKTRITRTSSGNYLALMIDGEYKIVGRTDD